MKTGNGVRLQSPPTSPDTHNRKGYHYLTRVPGKIMPDNDTAKRFFLFLLLPAILAGCISLEPARPSHRATSLSEIHRKPRILPRHGWVEASPTGRFTHQQPTAITLLDSGRDSVGSGSIQYLRHWSAYIGHEKYGDVPVHFVVDEAGAIWAGRNVSMAGELYQHDPFSRSKRALEQTVDFERVRTEKVPDMVKASRQIGLQIPASGNPGASAAHDPVVPKQLWGDRIPLDGHILVMVLGDLENNLLTERQEPVMFQLLFYLCHTFAISPGNIGLLSDASPVSENPGHRLRDYVESGEFSARIGEPKQGGDDNPFSLFRGKK